MFSLKFDSQADFNLNYVSQRIRAPGSMDWKRIPLLTTPAKTIP